MADAVDRLFVAIAAGDEREAQTAAFEIVTTLPSPAHQVTLSAYDVKRLAEMLNDLIGGPDVA